jgi:hypothetical protein
VEGKSSAYTWSSSNSAHSLAVSQGNGRQAQDLKIQGLTCGKSLLSEARASYDVADVWLLCLAKLLRVDRCVYQEGYQGTLNE